MPSLTNHDGDFYYYGYKGTICLETQVQISCMIKQENGDEYNCVLCDPWIKSLLGHKLVNPKDFKTKQGFFLCLFMDK
jgi:hypothetical protein